MSLDGVEGLCEGLKVRESGVEFEVTVRVICTRKRRACMAKCGLMEAVHNVFNDPPLHLAFASADAIYGGKHSAIGQKHF